jgi:hypothetical protein
MFEEVAIVEDYGKFRYGGVTKMKWYRPKRV